MPLKSMTGFARSQGALCNTTWQWELRSVNGRNLDIRLRLPPGNEALDAAARELCTKKVNRGNLSLNLALARQGSATVVRLNEATLLQVSAAMKRAAELCPAAPPSLDGILALRGVLEVVEPEEPASELAARHEAILASLSTALDGLVADRGQEGERLTRALAAQIDEIDRLTKAAELSPLRTPERIEARLREQIERLFAAGGGQFERERLHQEAMLLAVRADVEEELQRLKSHILEARNLLSAGGPAGRKLDFLAQEFFREANTLCSKASDVEITRIGLGLKAVIDQLREQVQNIE